MKKFKKILAIVLLIFVVAIGCLAVWQRGNIASLITSVKFSKDELAEKIDSNKKKTDELVSQYSENAIRDFTHEEEEQIRRGEITPEQALEKIISEAKGVGGFSAAPSSPIKENSEEVKTTVSDYVSQLYLLKAQYIAKLGDLERRAKSEYKAIPKGEKGASAKQSFASKYIGEASKLESECDGKVEAILSSIQRTIKEQGGDINIVKAIRKTYEEEKILKKSYYINTYRQ